MMFNKLKTKLTLLYTSSLLVVLLCIIGLFYIIISHQINENENEDLQSFLKKEKMEFIEDLYEKDEKDEKDEKGLSLNPNREIFYYIFDKNNHFAYGEESIPHLSGWIEENNFHSRGNSYTKKVTWKKAHLIIMKSPLSTNGYVHGYAIVGKDITNETHLIEGITWSLLFLTIFFSLLYGGMGYYFAGQAIKPIKTAFHKQEKFVSDASHELRTPLSIFYSSIDLLSREEKENLSVLGREVLEDVKAEAELMNKLINDLLFLARTDKNALNMVKKEVNLSKLVSSLCIRFSRKASGNIQFIYEIEENIRLTCDESRIQQLLYILLDNAYRYTKDGKVELTLIVNPGKIILTVSDTGCGIALNDIPYIFDRFYRGDLSREKGGAGLGLSIAKAIVTAHDGKIFAASELGKGTNFTVVFEKSKK